MARQCHRQEERLRLRQRGRKGRLPCRTDSHGLELLGETEKAAGEATDGNGRKNGTRCDGKCSALQRATQRAEMTDAACCIFLSTFPGNPEQSALISPPAHSSTQINQPSHRHRPSSAHLPTHVFLSHQHVLRPSETPTPSTACALVFHSKRTCLPLPERLPPHCQSVCLPPPTRSSSTTRTFGFLCQHACLPLPARSASSACTFSSSCQNPRNPQPTESPSQPTGSPASVQAARAAR